MAIAWYLPESFSSAARARSLGVPLLTAERTTTPWVVRLGKAVETVRG